MKIVLLGATGFVGHHLLPQLSSAGHRCIALSRYRPGHRELTIIPRVDVRQVSIYDPAALRRQLEDADAVINMVGILNEPGRNGQGFYRAHVELAEILLEAMRAAGVRRLLQVSALNAGKGESHYLKTKGQAEERIRAAQDIDATIVQPSVIFGDGDSFFTRFASLLKFTPVLPLACPGARMQPVWVRDVAAAMTASLKDRTTWGATLPLVGPKVYTLRQLVEFTARTAGLRRKIVGLSDGLSRLQGRVMDFVPGKPFSTDNYLSLQVDNVSGENALERFGIRPRSLETVVPSYINGTSHQQHLDQFRKRS